VKLDLKNNTALWVTEASRLLGLAPVFSMMCAVTMLILAVFSVNDVLRNAEVQKKSQELPEFSLKKVPVGNAVYNDYARVLARLSPDVQVAADRDGIRIEIASPAHYAEFMYVLNSVQGVSRDVVWHAQEICLAGCSGKASVAVVRGMTEKVEVKLRGQNNE
jgi:hypothetical protein